jgi:hypothetical protein
MIMITMMYRQLKNNEIKTHSSRSDLLLCCFNKGGLEIKLKSDDLCDNKTLETSINKVEQEYPKIKNVYKIK